MCSKHLDKTQHSFLLSLLNSLKKYYLPHFQQKITFPSEAIESVAVVISVSQFFLPDILFERS